MWPCRRRRQTSTDGPRPRENLWQPEHAGFIFACPLTGVETDLERRSHSSWSMVGPSNQGLRDLIARDPDAVWDETTQSVQNSAFTVSPRILGIAVFDPRTPIRRNGEVDVIKFVAFFAERMTGPAEVRGRFLRVPGWGTNAAESMSDDGPAPALPNSWGRVKAAYR